MLPSEFIKGVFFLLLGFFSARSLSTRFTDIESWMVISLKLDEAKYFFNMICST